MLIIKSELIKYKEDFGKYPSTQEGLETLVQKRGLADKGDTKKLILDAWGNRIHYYSEGEHFTIISKASERKFLNRIIYSKDIVYNE